ncbi:small GTPase superfamily, partial [Lactarius indigo]
SSVEKSSLLLRFSDKQWLSEDEASATIDVDFRVHKLGIERWKAKINIWVYPQEHFRTITVSYYCGTQGVCPTLYDVSNRESFEALPRWLQIYVPPEVIKIVCNKPGSEYPRQVPTTKGASFTQRTGYLLAEASAKTVVDVGAAR